MDSHFSLQDQVEKLEGQLAEALGEIDALKRTIISLQPKYHTLMNTFHSVDEAQAVWILMHMYLYPERHKAMDSVPPMPMGRAYIAPWDDYVPDQPKTTEQERVLAQFKDEL